MNTELHSEEVAAEVERTLRELLAAHGHIERGGRVVEAGWTDGPSEEAVLEAVRNSTPAGELTGIGSLPEGTGSSYTYPAVRLLLRREVSRRAVATAAVLELVLNGCAVCSDETAGSRRIAVHQNDPERVRSHPEAQYLVAALGEEGTQRLEEAIETFAGLLPEMTGSTHTQLGTAAGVLCGLEHLEGLYQIHSALC